MFRRRLRLLALILGFCVVIVLVAQNNAMTIASAVSALGFGVFALPLCIVPHTFGAAISWRLLILGSGRVRLRAAVIAIWIGHAIETLLPGGGIGGEAVKIRLILKNGVVGSRAIASVVVDVMVQTLVLLLWSMIGLVTLLSRGAVLAVIWPTLIGMAVLGIALIVFFIALNAGVFRPIIRSLANRIQWLARDNVIEGAQQIDAAIFQLIRSPRKIAGATAIRVATRLCLAFEFWLAGYLMGGSLILEDAVILTGIVAALRAAVAVVPGGWGVQEGGYVLLGSVIGLPPELVLAISLATRAREVLMGVPALAVWQFIETRGAAARRHQRNA